MAVLGPRRIGVRDRSYWCDYRRMNLEECAEEVKQASKAWQDASDECVRAVQAAGKAKYDLEIAERNYSIARLEAYVVSPWRKILPQIAMTNCETIRVPVQGLRKLPVVGTTNCEERIRIPITVIK